MKKNLTLLLSIMLVIWCLPGCQTKEKTASNENCYKLVSAEEFDKLLSSTKEKVKLIDVRTKEEFDEGHIKGSLNWDILNNDFGNNFTSLSKNEHLYIYCRSGGRSKTASTMLTEKGFCNVIELDGGFLAWRENGKEFEN